METFRPPHHESKLIRDRTKAILAAAGSDHPRPWSFAIAAAEGSAALTRHCRRVKGVRLSLGHHELVYSSEPDETGGVSIETYQYSGGILLGRAVTMHSVDRIDAGAHSLIQEALRLAPPINRVDYERLAALLGTNPVIAAQEERAA